MGICVAKKVWDDGSFDVKCVCVSLEFKHLWCVCLCVESKPWVER